MFFLRSIKIYPRPSSALSFPYLVLATIAVVLSYSRQHGRRFGPKTSAKKAS